jgi:AraC family transcriptional regulator
VKRPLLCSELRFAEIEFKPRLFFFDLDIWETALKLKAQLQNSWRSQKAYVEALGIALAHELTRMNEDTPSLASDARGGLPHWQQKKLTQYIEEHLADEVSLFCLWLSWRSSAPTIFLVHSSNRSACRRTNI